jgi:septal ring factor EnvC (AmiA/AmiB activator)
MIGAEQALIAVGGLVVGAIGKAYAQRQDRGSKEDSALARVLERRDEDCRRLQDRLSAATTESDMRGAQVADLAVRVEHAMQQIATMQAERAEEREETSRSMADCEKRNADLAARVFRLERKSTPPGDTPAVGIQKPVQHEEVGHE